MDDSTADDRTTGQPVVETTTVAADRSTAGANRNATDTSGSDRAVKLDGPNESVKGFMGAVETVAAVASQACFEVFCDRADEWRWRLVHRNGNVIASSGEGYTRKHNAKRGCKA